MIQLLTIIDYYVFIFPGIVAPLRLLSNLSSNWKFIAKYWKYISELPIQQYNTLTVTPLSLVLMMKNVSHAVLLCPSPVLYALLKSVLVYFSCSLGKSEFVKSAVKCWEISHCLHHSKIPAEDNLKDFHPNINDINESIKYYRMNILFGRFLILQ